MKKDSDVYVFPEKAREKLQYAEKRNSPVYIFGTTGWGKTELVKQYLKKKDYYYYSCINEREELRSVIKKTGSNPGRKKCIVFDDLWSAKDEEIRSTILNLLQRNDCWLILINRALLPKWLVDAYVNFNFVTIDEKTLNLSEEETRILLEQNDIKVTEEEFACIFGNTKGNVFSLTLIIRLIRQGKTVSDELIDDMWRMCLSYFESEIMTNWDIEIVEFLCKICVVDQFDLQLAAFVTGDSHALNLIENTMTQGNFLWKTDECYQLRPFFLPMIRKYAVKRMGLDEYKRYAYTAGLFYESQNRITDALKMYEISGEKNRVKELLIRNGRHNPGTGYFFELKDYYFQLSEEEIMKSPVLLSSMSMLYSLLLQPEKSEYWYEKLKEYGKTASGGIKREVLSQKAYLDLALPHRGSEHLKDIIVGFPRLLMDKGVNLRELSVTSNLPSVMNGGKDFCSWSKHDIELAATIGKIVQKVVGSYGAGLIEEALGESMYEKREDDFNTLTYLSKASVKVENGGKKEMLFAITGLQVRMGIVHGDIEHSIRLITAFREKCDEKTDQGILQNLFAMNCRIALYQDRIKDVDHWLEQTQTMDKEFCILNRYCYLTKVRCYIAKGEYLTARTILEKLGYYAEVCKRTYIRMEVRMLKAIIYYRMEERWKDEMMLALEEAAEYHFVRLFSEEGNAILPLLKGILSDCSEKEKSFVEFVKTIVEEAKMIAAFYPFYLRFSAVKTGDFCENARKILQFQAEGKTIAEMSELLHVSQQTIKYHASENYKKLGVKGKIEAVQKAKSLKII